MGTSIMQYLSKSPIPYINRINKKKDTKVNGLNTFFQFTLVISFKYAKAVKTPSPRSAKPLKNGVYTTTLSHLSNDSLAVKCHV